MKKIFCLFLLTLLTLSVSAQSGEVKLKATPSHAGVVGSNALASNPEYTQWYSPNSQVECYAKPKEGYRFVAWKRGNAIVSTDNPMIFIMGTEDLAFEAVFVFDPVSPNPPGVSRFDASTGELRLVNNDPFGLYDGLRSTENLPGISDLAEKVTNDLGEVTTLTLVGYFPQIIGDYKYLEPFYNLKKLDMSRTNLSYVGYRAFAANYNMETVVLPASVKKMEGRLFDSDNSICDIICYANIPPKVDPETFMIPDTMLYGMMKPIPATVYVPKASVPIYKSTEYWNELEIEPVVEEATNVVVDLPEAADGRYRNMSLVLEDRATLLQKSLIVRDQTSYIFYGLPSNTSYNVRLENSKGQVIGQVNNVTLEEESITVGFPSLKKLCSASVRVESLDGTDLTEKAQFRWMLPDGSIVGQQSTLGNMVEGSELTCQVCRHTWRAASAL